MEKKTDFKIASISREDLKAEGFNTENIDDATMEKLAKLMKNDYLEQLYWESMKILAEEMEIPKTDENIDE